MRRTLLRLEDVTFRRGDARVLRGVTWEVAAGQQWAVLGPNGCGKTTLMMIATGYLPSSGGRTYLVEGWISEINLPRVREKVAFASAALHDQMLKHHAGSTGFEIVVSGRFGSVGLYRTPTPEERSEARKWMRRLDAEHLADARFGLMSTGQRQRCLLGRAYMARARLVILDEPCAGLDVGARERLLDTLQEACRRQPEVPHVLVTHHPQEIVPPVTHVLLMRDGRAVAQGPKDQVLSAENLEETFGIPLRLVRRDGRVWVLPAG
jgi:iron complex transport system ATP-binding protein